MPLKRLLFGTAVGLVALWLAVRGHSLAALAAAVGGADPAGVWLALGSVGATIVALTARWQLLFSRLGAPGSAGAAPPLRALFGALVIGQAANIALPVRVGEVLRVYVASRTCQVPVSAVVGTMIVERLADTVMTALSAMALIMFVPLPGWLAGPARAWAIAGVAAVCGLAAVALSGATCRRWIRSTVPASGSIGRAVLRVARYGAMAVEQVASVRDWRALTSLTVLSALTLALSASTNYLLFRAFGIPLDFLAALLVLIVLQLGAAPVSTPGNVGVFQYLTVLALGVYAVDGTTALAYSMVLWAVALGPKLLLGAVMFGVVTRRGVLEPRMWAKLNGGT